MLYTESKEILGATRGLIFIKQSQSVFFHEIQSRERHTLQTVENSLLTHLPLSISMYPGTYTIKFKKTHLMPKIKCVCHSLQITMF